MSTMHMLVHALRRWRPGRHREGRQDAAVLARLDVFALQAQRLQLLLQALEFRDAFGHVVDVRI